MASDLQLIPSKHIEGGVNMLESITIFEIRDLCQQGKAEKHIKQLPFGNLAEGIALAAQH